jgi:hypothetical protein
MHPGRSHLYRCDLSEIEIEIAIEIEKIWGIDPEPDFDFDRTQSHAIALPMHPLRGPFAWLRFFSKYPL